MQIYVLKDGRKLGPFAKEQIQAMLASGEISSSDSACIEGHDTWQPLNLVLDAGTPEQAPGIGAAQAGSSSPAKTAYLYISTERLIFMSVFSLGIFISYWVYKNWRYIKERDGQDIMPFWRGWFSLFYLYPLLEYIKNDPKVSHPEKPDYSSGWLTCGFFFFAVCGNQICIPSMLTFLFILPAHNYISRINLAVESPQEFAPWSFGQILCLTPALLFAIVLVASMAR